MPQSKARHLRIDFVITAALTSMETIWHLAQSESSIRLRELWLKGGKNWDKHSCEGKNLMSYQAEDLSSPLNFSGLMKRPDKKKKKWKRKTMATQNGVEWNSDPLPFDIWWSHYVTIYLNSFEFMQTCRERDRRYILNFLFEYWKHANPAIAVPCMQIWNAFPHTKNLTIKARSKQ